MQIYSNYSSSAAATLCCVPRALGTAVGSLIVFFRPHEDPMDVGVMTSSFFLAGMETNVWGGFGSITKS